MQDLKEFQKEDLDKLLEKLRKEHNLTDKQSESLKEKIEETRKAYEEKREENVNGIRSSMRQSQTGHIPINQEYSSPRTPNLNDLEYEAVKFVIKSEKAGEKLKIEEFIKTVENERRKEKQITDDQVKEIGAEKQLGQEKAQTKEQAVQVEEWQQVGKYGALKQTHALQTAAELMKEVEERQRLNALQQGKGKGLGRS